MIARCLLTAVLALGLSVSVTTATEAPAEPAVPSVTPIKEGATAPFTGLLVPESRLAELLRAELRVELLRGKLSIQEQTAQALEAMYLGKLEQATEPVPWYRTESFNRWFGFGLGVAFTGLAIYGTVELSKAIK